MGGKTEPENQERLFKRRRLNYLLLHYGSPNLQTSEKRDAIGQGTG